MSSGPWLLTELIYWRSGVEANASLCVMRMWTKKTNLYRVRGRSGLFDRLVKSKILYFMYSNKWTCCALIIVYQKCANQEQKLVWYVCILFQFLITAQYLNEFFNKWILIKLQLIVWIEICSNANLQLSTSSRLLNVMEIRSA